MGQQITRSGFATQHDASAELRQAIALLEIPDVDDDAGRIEVAELIRDHYKRYQQLPAYDDIRRRLTAGVALAMANADTGSQSSTLDLLTDQESKVLRDVVVRRAAALGGDYLAVEFALCAFQILRCQVLGEPVGLRWQAAAAATGRAVALHGLHAVVSGRVLGEVADANTDQAYAAGDAGRRDSVERYPGHRADASRIKGGATAFSHATDRGQPQAAGNRQQVAGMVDDRVADRGRAVDDLLADVDHVVAETRQSAANLVPKARLLGRLVPGLTSRVGGRVAGAGQLAASTVERVLGRRALAHTEIGERQHQDWQRPAGHGLGLLNLLGVGDDGRVGGGLSMIPQPNGVRGLLLRPGQGAGVSVEGGSRSVEGIAGFGPFAGLAMEDRPKGLRRRAGPPLRGVDAPETLAGVMERVAVGGQVLGGLADRAGVPGDEGFRVLGLAQFGGHGPAAGSVFAGPWKTWLSFVSAIS